MAQTHVAVPEGCTHIAGYQRAGILQAVAHRCGGDRNTRGMTSVPDHDRRACSVRLHAEPAARYAPSTFQSHAAGLAGDSVAAALALASAIDRPQGNAHERADVHAAATNMPCLATTSQGRA
jgi:hypothetical protein